MDYAILIVAASGLLLTLFVFNYNRCENKKKNALTWANDVKDFVIQCYNINHNYECIPPTVVESQLKGLELKTPYIRIDCFHLGGSKLAELVDNIAKDLRLMMDENEGKSANVPSTAHGITHDLARTLEADVTIMVDEILKIKCHCLKF